MTIDRQHGQEPTRVHGIAALYRDHLSASGLAGEFPRTDFPVVSVSDLPTAAAFELHAFASADDADLFEEGVRVTLRNDFELVRPSREDPSQWIVLARFDRDAKPGYATLEEAIPLVDHRTRRAEIERRRALAPLIEAEAASPKHPRRIGMKALKVSRRTPRGAMVECNLVADIYWPQVEIVLQGAPEGGPWWALLHPPHFEKAWDGTYDREMDAEITGILEAGGASINSEGALRWPVTRADLIDGLAGFQLTLDKLGVALEARENAWKIEEIRHSQAAFRVREALCAGGSLIAHRVPGLAASYGTLEHPRKNPVRVSGPELSRLEYAGIIVEKDRLPGEPSVYELPGPAPEIVPAPGM